MGNTAGAGITGVSTVPERRPLYRWRLEASASIQDGFLMQLGGAAGKSRQTGSAHPQQCAKREAQLTCAGRGTLSGTFVPGGVTFSLSSSVVVAVQVPSKLVGCRVKRSVKEKGMRMQLKPSSCTSPGSTQAVVAVHAGRE